MIKNNKGITMMTLVITIVTMVILISIVGYFSIESINNSHISNEKKEMADVLEYVLVRKAKLLNNEFDVEEKYGDISGKAPIVTEELLELVARNLEETGKNNIIEVNQNSIFPDEYKYIYITADKLNNEALSTEYTVIRDVKNNYIINFYTGTVIGLYDNGERIESSGIIKGIAEIESTLY